MVTNSTGVAVLGKTLESKEFPQGEHPLLCKRKLNYVIMGPSCFVHEIPSIQMLILRRRSTVSTGFYISLSSAVPELTWVCTKSMYIKAQLKLIKIPAKCWSAL